MLPRAPISTLFPYTTLFRSKDLDKLYERLCPTDYVIRHRWLFEKSWPELSAGREKDRERRLLLIDRLDRKSTRLNSSHGYISYAVLCLKKNKYSLLLESGFR